MISLHLNKQHLMSKANTRKNTGFKFSQNILNLTFFSFFILLSTFASDSRAQASFSNVNEAAQYCNDMAPDAKDRFLQFVIPLADKGDRDASFALGSRYVLTEMCGQPSKPLYLEGLELWKKAARQKHIQAAINLSDYYSAAGRGKGKVRSDPISSLKWAALAEAFNNEMSESKDLTQQMSHARNRIFIQSRLNSEVRASSPAQGAEAKPLIEGCLRDLSTCK